MSSRTRVVFIKMLMKPRGQTTNDEMGENQHTRHEVFVFSKVQRIHVVYIHTSDKVGKLFLLRYKQTVIGKFP